MQASLRKTLIDSHVAAITIAILIFSALATALTALLGIVFGVLYNLAPEATKGTGLANLNLVPYMKFDDATRIILSSVLPNLSTTLSFLIQALAGALTAYLLSNWVYGAGPLHVLGSYRGKLSRKTHA